MPDKKAVLYCRISARSQLKKGHGLESQEHRCREYAKYKGYQVAEVFREEGVSGGLIDRPGMQAMLKFLRKKKSEEYVVIIDDISRLARSIEAHIKLRSAIGSVGAKLESPSIEFGDDPDSILVENLMASVSQHQRQKNAQQVKNRMRARILSGYWCFYAVVGYKHELVEGHGKMLVRDEPIASIVQEALEGYATGRFETQTEVKRFLEASPAFPKRKGGVVHLPLVQELLQRRLYTGFIDVPKWDISLHPGKHEPLISLETWQAIQERLKGQAKAPARKDLNEDFPLRGAIVCGHCEKPFTAAWTKGRNSLYPYYLCQTKGCRGYKKSIRKETLEGEFEQLLRQLRPNKNLISLASRIFKDVWEDRVQRLKTDGKFVETEISQIERKTEQFLERIVGSDSPTLIKTYESQIQKLEERKVALKEKIGKCGRPAKSFDETYRTAIEFLGNPYKLWSSGRFEDKRTVLKLVFAKRLAYIRNQGYRTASLSLPFCLIGQLKGSDYDLVELRGIEPLTS